jgi:hypothetical protein
MQSRLYDFGDISENRKVAIFENFKSGKFVTLSKFKN